MRFAKYRFLRLIVRAYCTIYNKDFYLGRFSFGAILHLRCLLTSCNWRRSIFGIPSMLIIGWHRSLHLNKSTDTFFTFLYLLMRECLGYQIIIQIIYHCRVAGVCDPISIEFRSKVYFLRGVTFGCHATLSSYSNARFSGIVFKITTFLSQRDAWLFAGYAIELLLVTVELAFLLIFEYFGWSTAAGCEMFVDAVRSRNSEIVRFAVTLSYRDIEASRLNLHEVACSDEGTRNRKGKRGRTAAAFYYILPFISRRLVYRINDNCSRSTFIIDFCLRDGRSFKCINMEILLGNACFSCCHRFHMK